VIQFSDDLIEELQQLAVSDEYTRYRIGDIADALCVEFPQWTKEEVYAEVGKWCSRSKHTVRSYREVAQFWPWKRRQEYDMLSWHHIKALKGAAKGETHQEKLADAVRLADKCLEEHDNWGGIPSVDGLRAWLHKENGSPPAWMRYVTQLESLAVRILQRDDSPAWLRSLAAAVQDAVERHG